MIKHFEKFGTVHLADDSKLTKEQRKEKYKVGGGLLHVIATSIIEEILSPPPSNYKVLPVLELSVQVIGGVESPSNERKFCCPIWENKKFISTNIDKKKLTQKAVTSLGSILDTFMADYQHANPERKPQFFLYH